MFEIVDNFPESAVIRVIGIGDGGCNAVDYMLEKKLKALILFVLILMRRL